MGWGGGGKHQSAPVPLSLHCLGVLGVSKRQESGEREDGERRVGALFGGRWTQAEVKVHTEERGVRQGERAPGRADLLPSL